MANSPTPQGALETAEGRELWPLSEPFLSGILLLRLLKYHLGSSGLAALLASAMQPSFLHWENAFTQNGLTGQ